MGPWDLFSPPLYNTPFALFEWNPIYTPDTCEPKKLKKSLNEGWDHGTMGPFYLRFITPH